MTIQNSAIASGLTAGRSIRLVLPDEFNGVWASVTPLDLGGAAADKVSRDATYDGKVAKMCIPDAVEFVDELPHTATGKILKTKLREDFKDYSLPS